MSLAALFFLLLISQSAKTAADTNPQALKIRENRGNQTRILSCESPMTLFCMSSPAIATAPKPLATQLPSSSSSSSTWRCGARCSLNFTTMSAPRRTGLVSGNGTRRSQSQVVRMAPEEERLTRRNPLDFPIEWDRPKPGRRPDIFPQFSPMKTPLPPPMPYDPPEEDEEEEEKKEEEEDPDKEEEPEQPERQ